jgi:D-apionolactonase
VPKETVGGLSATVTSAELRDVRVAGYSALDAVYVTVRDANWRTVPAEVVSSQTVETAQGTTTELEVRHQLGNVDFRWRGAIDMAADRLRFTMDGVAERDFNANRIGFCLLHPQALKGRPLRVGGPDGQLSGTFPHRVSPHQLFTGIDRMTYGVGDGAELDVRLEGDLFETEDHRNWSDPGWKTYCTPLAAPRPVHQAAGRHTRQTVELRAKTRSAAARLPAANDTARVAVGATVIGAVPSLGLGASCLESVSPAAREAVRGLGPAHLHVEIEDGSPWQSRLELAVMEAAELAVPLDVAIVAEPGRIAAIAERVARSAGTLGRVSVFSPLHHTTDTGTVATARTILGDSGKAVQLGGGSRADFTEFNRGDFDLGTWDFAAYGLTPQVHHTDDRSILATASAVADCAGQAKAIAGGLPVAVGPITLRPRFNATAGRAGQLPAGDADGPDVDQRQHTPLAGLYLAAAVSRLVGACAATAYRTVGPRGVVTVDGAPTLAARVVSELTSVTGAEVRHTDCTDTVVVLAAAKPSGLRLLIANLAARSARLELAGATAIEAAVLGGDALDPSRLVLPPRSVTSIRAVEA